MRSTGGPLNKVKGGAHAKSDGAEKHQQEIGSGTGESHERRAMRMAAGPVGIVRGTGEADHAAIEKKETEQGKNHHAIGRASNVGDGIQGDLATQRGGVVATQLGDEGMGGFMTGGGEKKNDVVDEAKD